MAIKVVKGLETSEQPGDVVQANWPSAISVSRWVPIMAAPVACIVRNVIIVPDATTALNTTNYWTANLMASRTANGNPVGAPGTTGTDLIAARPINGTINNWLAKQPWDFGSVVWTEAEATLLPGDTLGIWFAETGAPADLPAATLLTARIAPTSV